MKAAARKRLAQLLAVPSPSGEEGAIQAHVAHQLGSAVPGIYRDVHGNQYYPLPRKGRPRVMLCAHCDEIGLMVRGIDDHGFLQIAPIGGVDGSTLQGQRVRIGNVRGVIGCPPIHFRASDEKPKPVSIDKLWVDIGARNKAEAARRVAIGDALVLDTPVSWLRNDRIAARGLDNRIGVFILMETLKRLSRRRLAVDVVGVTSVQEEVGLRGATTSGYHCDPHLAINLDVNFATDHPLAEGARWGETALSAGPILARGAGVNPQLLAEFQAVAKQDAIPLQYRAEPDASGTDASALQRTRGGVATLDMGIPNRYMHTAVEMVCLEDVAHCIDLLTGWVIQCTGESDYVPR